MLRSGISIFVLSYMLVGCANLSTIGRVTHLQGDDQSKGVAIHLDAKQRLAFAKQFGAICAEPSPDALSAIASSLGASATIPQTGTANLAAALTESAGSIGLRTQSIQLMRDSLYRVCEAYYGKALNSAQLMQLHQRYQDTMLGILAVEQLTGATVARQAVLGGSANADAAGQLSQLATLLDQARARETEASEALQRAEQNRDDVSSQLETKRQELASARNTTPPTDTSALEAEVRQLESESAMAEERAKSAQERNNDAREAREAIEKNHGAALSTANAAASSSGAFSTNARVVNLNSQSTQYIANAVEGIVRTVVEKDRVFESCLKIVGDKDKGRQVIDVCRTILLGTKDEKPILETR